MGAHRKPNKHGRPRGPYWTQAHENEYRAYLVEQAQREAEHRAAVRERRRIGNRRRQARWRAKRKLLGLPFPKRKPEPPGSSTKRTRLWAQRKRERKAAEQAAILAAALIAKKAHQRERQAASRERRKERVLQAAIDAAAYLDGQWFSSPISESEAKTILTQQYPDKDSSWIDSQYRWLETCANSKLLNLNIFTLVEGGAGIQLADEQRAIFFEIQHKSNRLDYGEIIKEAAVMRLRDMSDFKLENEARIQNAIVKSCFYAQGLWGRGQAILSVVKAVTK